MTSSSFSRRAFLEFVGAATAGTAMAQTKGTGNKTGKAVPPAKLPKGVAPSTGDELVTANGLQYDVIVKAGDRINKAGDVFGWDNDFTAFMPLAPNEAFLFVNHESAHPLLTAGLAPEGKMTKEVADKLLSMVGCSVLKIRRDNTAAPWKLDPEDASNRRISGLTPIPLVASHDVGGTTTVMGTCANCSGGQTPWRTFLTCEENYNQLWGELNSTEPPLIDMRPFYPNAKPEHYGWVTEVDPFTGNARKLTALGRFGHEGARVVIARDGRPVVYMGDDTTDQCIYKFIGDVPGSLATGTLYVADSINGKWLALDHAKNAKLREKFIDQMDVLVNTRAAARLIGGTPQDRPEGIDIQPATGAIVISLTNNETRGNYFGSLLKIEEKGGDYTALEFKQSTLLLGGPESGVSCPDNIRFDPRGNLWIATDMSEKSMGTPMYRQFGNNGLFYVPLHGKTAGKPIQVASAPHDAEFTGPSFADDGKTLFLSVQHPGLTTTDLANPTSHWPEGGKSLPRPAVIGLRGSLLDNLTAIS